LRILQNLVMMVATVLRIESRQLAIKTKIRTVLGTSPLVQKGRVALPRGAIHLSRMIAEGTTTTTRMRRRRKKRRKKRRRMRKKFHHPLQCTQGLGLRGCDVILFLLNVTQPQAPAFGIGMMMALLSVGRKPRS